MNAEQKRIMKVINEISKLPGYYINAGEIFIPSGITEQCRTFNFGYDKGSYSILEPVNSALHDELSIMAGLPQISEKPDVIGWIDVTPQMAATFKKAVKMVSKDDLRFALTGVLIDAGKGCIVATDAYAILRSKFEPVCHNFPEQMIIPVEAAKEIAAAKKGGKIEICSNGTHYFGKVEFKPIDAKFPDYNAVIPRENKYRMTVDTAAFAGVVKNVCDLRGKFETNLIQFHINGKIKAANLAKLDNDRDKHTHKSAVMEYISSNVPDMDIAFNGEILHRALSICPAYVTMQIESANRGVLIQNGNDTVLVMPRIAPTA